MVARPVRSLQLLGHDGHATAVGGPQLGVLRFYVRPAAGEDGGSLVMALGCGDGGLARTHNNFRGETSSFFCFTVNIGGGDRPWRKRIVASFKPHPLQDFLSFSCSRGFLGVCAATSVPIGVGTCLHSCSDGADSHTCTRSVYR